MNGNAIDEYPTNKFTEHEKGFDSDTFFKGRDGRTWMLDPEGFHIGTFKILFKVTICLVYCCTNAQDGDYGIGIHWANEIELALPVSRVNTAESEMTRDIGRVFSFENFQNRTKIIENPGKPRRRQLKGRFEMRFASAKIEFALELTPISSLTN